MIGDLRDVRTQLLIVVGVLLLADAAAVILMISPAGRSRAQRQEEFEHLRMEKQEKMRTTAPARDIDQKIGAAREEEASFNQDRLAHRYSTMSEQLSKIATESGVNVSDVKYDEHDTEKTAPAGYGEVGITIQIHGTYDQDIRFINTVERQKMLLLIDSVSFSGMQGDALTVSVHLSTFLRSQA
jgi:Tfp pilus assembly protein PilO